MWLYALVTIIWTAQHACTVKTSTEVSTACDHRHLPRCTCSSDRKEAECRNFNFSFNNITPDYFPDSLIKLDLASNNLTEITGLHFLKLTSLEELHLNKNKISKIGEETFTNLFHLKSLRLENNQFTSVPAGALTHLKSLELLNLGNNKLTIIPSRAFSNLKNLYVLLLKKNQIVEIEEKAFVSLKSLRILELDNNLLMHFPTALENLISLQELSISNNKIKYVPGGVLQKAPGLLLIELQGNPLVGLDPYSFSNLPKLRKLTMSEARGLTHFPELNGTSSLEVLKLDRSNLREIPFNLCETCPRLKSLDLKWNKLMRVPNLNLCHDLRVLDLAHNYITSLDGNQFKSLTQLHDLLLPHNVISKIPREAFNGLVRLQVLNLEGNMIENIHPEAFLNFTQLEDLNLGNNIFPKLPSNGLDRLLHLKTFNNPHLKDFPKPDNFPRIQTLVLSYAYHCCSFLHLIRSDSPKPPVQESVLFPTDTEFDMSLWNSSFTDLWPLLQNLSKKFGMEINELWDNFGSDFTYPGHLPAYVEEYFEEQESKTGPSERPIGTVQCLPLPGPFLPCQDLFDWWTLRCGVWIVFLLAMLGNGTVVFVLVFSRNKMDVPRFLVCNLAAADFFMGIYLGFLAVVDASTLGEFRKYAIPWQMSIGCQLAGFLGVLSSELSVYTLAVITLERNYAITHAMHLNKRLSLKHAGYIMACGWSFALIMSLLPLFGVSDYRKFAICLPFETETPGSLTYVVFLMIINGVAFLILMGCYLKMYCAIRGSQAWNSNDSRIAKRMALLVFTDFLCWSPIAFFSLTAAFGLQLISLEQAKVFTVFVLPLNSCCNPFLYAILTKQFKKDCILICKAIEESRVTRGIGRCRHSSNFSNRQTPANTNSLVDRSSRDNQHAHQQQCSCSAKLLVDSASETLKRASSTTKTSRKWLNGKMQWLVFCFNRRTEGGRSAGSDHYAFQIAEIQQKTHKRASSVSSSENFSSSRSDSWRQNHLHHCGIPLRLLDPKKRANSWLVTRKTSQDSNLSSSRNDSSGSATTQSTSTWRMSRSSASSDVRTQIIPNAEIISNKSRIKPRLTRQSAITDDFEVVTAPSSPGRLTVRFLTTIPSAAETSMQNEDEILPESSTSQKKVSSSDEAISKFLIRDQCSPTRDKSTLTSKMETAPTPPILFFENLECRTEFDFLAKSSQETTIAPLQTSSSSSFNAERKSLPTIRSAPSLCIPISFSSPTRSVNKNSNNKMTGSNSSEIENASLQNSEY